MIILDLALQGIRDLAGSIRVRLQSGYNALVSAEVELVTVLTGLVELLFAQGYDPSLAALAAPGAKTTGGGVTVMTEDGGTFRIMRDLVAGSGQLLEFDRDTKSFTQLSADASEIAQFLRGRVGLPSRVGFESVFVLRPGDLPSQEGVPDIDLSSPSGTPSSAALRARLEEIERALAESQKIEELEFELDGLQKERFTLEDQMKAMSFDRSDLVEVREQAKRIGYLDAMPDDFKLRYEAYLKLVRRRDADITRWEGEREALERSERVVPVDPLVSDWRLWAGLATGTLAVVAAFLLGGLFRYIAFLDIPAYGLAAFVLFQNLTQRQQREQAGWKFRLSDERRDKILARDAEELAAAEEILDKVGLSETEEVHKAINMRGQVRGRLAQLTKAEEEAAKDPELRALREKHDDLAKRIGAMEEQLSNMSSVPIDAMALKGEAEHIRKQLGIDESAKQAHVDHVHEGPMGNEWFKAALDLLLTDPHSAANLLSERASLLIRALSGNKLVAVVLEPGGTVTLRSAQGGVATWDRMPAAARDLAYLSLRGGLFLAVDQKSRCPMVGGGLAGRMASGQQVTQTLFTTLGHGGQLIHLVKRPDEAPQAKHVATVKTS